MNFFRNLLLIFLIGLVCASCAKKENYPDVPVITYNNFAAYYTGSSDVIDSSILTINFTDGNGDIGYPSQETNVTSDLYVLPLIYYYRTKSYGPWIINNDTDVFPYNIPYITPVGNDKELSGLIKINTEHLLQEITDFFIADTGLYDTADPNRLEFKVWMYDRAGNKSNVLLTPVLHTLPE